MLPVESARALGNSQSQDLVEVLSGLAVQLRALRALLAEPPTPEQLARVAQGLAQTEERVTTLLAELRLASETLEGEEPEQQTERLVEALGRLVEERAEAFGAASRLQVTGEAQRLDPSAAVLLYRLTRAALATIAHHRAVRHLRLALHYGRQELQLILSDDGEANEEGPVVAAPPFTPAASGQEALEALGQQLRAMGGSLTSSARPGQGHEIRASLPYERPPGSSPPAPAAARGTRPPPTHLQTLRLLVVAGQPVMRAGLRRLLESYPDLQVIGEAANGIQASGEVLELGPQVVVFDLPLLETQALETLRQMKQLSPDAHILVLSASSRPEDLSAVLRAGADGYLLREVAPDELVQAIRAIARGETVVQPQLAARLLTSLSQGEERAPATSLTTRERQVLLLLARGLRNKEIARRLQVSERTVNFHLANIYQKLHVSGRTEALSRALEEGLLPLDALASPQPKDE
ncbi:LuxR C-terminal-related transcriptional regulator [Thermogemmatispora sp.]|uniref:LuxR C-terminal-related transcriptional regulator n=1 Tax=Thermogemmatispora sp. TaxID=1968838 RepID=UPI0035E43732